MTVKHTYDFMQQVRNLDFKIIRKQAEWDSLRRCLLPAGIRYDKDRVQTSPEDRMLEVAAKLDKLEREIGALKRKKADKIKKISDAIEKLDDEREKTVLTLFYIDRKRMDEVAAAMSYSERRVYQLKRKGVAHIADVIK